MLSLSFSVMDKVRSSRSFNGDASIISRSDGVVYGLVVPGSLLMRLGSIAGKMDAPAACELKSGLASVSPSCCWEDGGGVIEDGGPGGVLNLLRWLLCMVAAPFDEVSSRVGFDFVSDVTCANGDDVGSETWWGCGAAGGRGAAEADLSKSMSTDLCDGLVDATSKGLRRLILNCTL